MRNILFALKTIIERYVVGKQALTENVTAGEVLIPVRSSRRYVAGDQVAVYKKPAENESSTADIRTITEIPDWNSIVINEPTSQAYPAELSGVEKSHYGHFCDAVYIGNPDVLPGFPSITIEIADKTAEPMTIGTTQDTYHVDISVWSSGDGYESQYLLMMHYAEQIEQSLWRSFYPLVAPYGSSTLAEDMEPGEDLLKLTAPLDDGHPLKANGSLFIEGIDTVSEFRIKQDLGNNVYQTMIPTTTHFMAGDSVIRPHRYFFWSFPNKIDIGTVNATQGTLKAATLRYEMREQVIRRVGYHDPMTY